MRMLLRIQVPVAKGNQALQDGRLQRTVQSALGDIKPEAAYFLTLDGKRSALIVFDMADSSQIPAIAEPFFQELHAEVDLTPAMNPEDLMRGLDTAGLVR